MPRRFLCFSTGLRKWRSSRKDNARCGRKLGPYEIHSPLTADVIGEMYRAPDTRLERTVAIKILPKEMSADAARKRRFEREAKTISSLNHPHVRYSPSLLFCMAIG